MTGTFAALAAVLTLSLPTVRAVAGAKSQALGQKKAASQVSPKPVRISAKASSQGQWTAPANLCPPDNICPVGINAALLYTGQVLLWQYPQTSSYNSIAVLLNPTTGAVTDVSVPFDWDIFCSGLSILSDGRVLVAGGTVKGAPNSNSGENYTTLFDPATSTWTAGNLMSYARWYPSTILLPKGTVLVMSGDNETGTGFQLALESYDPGTGVWKTLPPSADLVEGSMYVYPRLSLLPSGKVVYTSPVQNSYVFDPVANTWSVGAKTLFGHRYFAGHALLPGLEKILVAGGTSSGLNGGGTATNTAEVIDYSQSKPVWTYTGSMTYARYNENLVLLADGTVLAVGGGGGGGHYTNPVMTPELYDPTTGVWTTMAPQQVQRTYHSSALLLPDGRVLSAGSDYGTQRQTYEIYSPPYLFNGAQPVITSVQSSVLYGAKFTFSTPDAASITRVALIRPGATTHADNFDQRYVDLVYTLGNGQITATAPASADYAPPGYYMLVIVNSSGVPSVMPFIKLD
ncbi:MAG TPA: galactose oxidase-like domain-containing protein [Terriglobia bacterium]|nr:galactose oxidase-like domain-containing protein [Terriglobia bacterium]